MSEHPVENPDGQNEVRRALADAAPATMPADVEARLAGVLAAETARREARTGQIGPVPGTVVPFGPAGYPPKPILVTPVEPARWRRAAGVVLVAAVSAAAIGAAGYTLSSAAGLNEPSAASPLQVQSAELAEQARSIENSRNLSAHTFSGAWRCARTVTAGRITGLTPAVVDGTPALLVYARVRGEDWVTVVTGCPEPGALARESVRLSP